MGADVGLINGGPDSPSSQERPDPRQTKSAGTFNSRSDERSATYSLPNATMEHTCTGPLHSWAASWQLLARTRLVIEMAPTHAGPLR